MYLGPVYDIYQFLVTVTTKFLYKMVFFQQLWTKPVQAEMAGNDDSETVFDPSMLNERQKQSLVDKINTKTLFAEGEGCNIWRNSVNTSGYPQMKLGLEIASVTGGHWPQNPACIMYSIKQDYVLLRHTNIRLSHLCHNRKCLKQSHVVMEPLATNVQRNFCAQNRACTSHPGQPDCIFTK